MKLKEIKNKFTELTDLKAIATNAKKYLKVKKDFRKKDTWVKVLSALEERFFSPLPLSELAKVINYCFSKTGLDKEEIKEVKTKLSNCYASLINKDKVTISDKELGAYAFFFIATGFYIKDVEAPILSAQDLFYLPYGDWFGRSFSYISAFAEDKGISLMLTLFPTTSDIEEAKERCKRIITKNLHDNCNLIPEFVTDYNHVFIDFLNANEEPVWKTMNDCEGFSTLTRGPYESDRYNDLEHTLVLEFLEEEVDPNHIYDGTIKRIESFNIILSQISEAEAIQIFHECYGVPIETMEKAFTKYRELLPLVQKDILIGKVEKDFDRCRSLRDVKEIRKKYAKQFHSDLTGGSDELMKEINKLYEEREAVFA